MGLKHIKIRPEGKSAVDIEIVLENPTFNEHDIVTITDHFSDYDGIAKHVREVVATY